jgi:hypothetical protein
MIIALGNLFGYVLHECKPSKKCLSIELKAKHIFVKAINA